jgi:hypothetical protein
MVRNSSSQYPTYEEVAGGSIYSTVQSTSYAEIQPAFAVYLHNLSVDYLLGTVLVGVLVGL